MPASTQTSDTPPTPESPETSETPTIRPRRGLPVGPFGLLVITAIALLGALGVTKLVVDAADGSDAVDIQDALNSQAVAPAVPEGARAELGSPAPNVRLDFLGGDTANLADIAGTGTPVVLNFWSSTCAPCITEMPAIEKVSQQLGDKVVVIGVDSQDTVESGQKMVDQTGVTYRNARDPKGEISTAFGALALPRTVLVDAAGKVVAMHSGGMDEAEFVKLLEENGFPTP